MQPKDAEIKVRVPVAMKQAIAAIAGGRFTSESEIAREAILEYLRSRNINLQEPPTPYGTSSSQADPKKDISGRLLGIVKKHHPRKRPGSPSPPEK